MFSDPSQYGILGTYYPSTDETEGLYVSTEYAEDEYEQAKRKFEEVSLEEYKRIYKNYEGAPAEPEKEFEWEEPAATLGEQPEVTKIDASQKPVKKWWQFWK